MQDETVQNDLQPTHSSENLPPITREPAKLPGNKEPAGHDVPSGVLKEIPPVSLSGPLSQQKALLPPKGLSNAAIAGVIAGVVAALLTIVVTLVFAGTFHAASQQIAVDMLTVKTALALAGLELLNVALSLLIGFMVGLIVGRIAVRRRLGFLAGILAGAVFYLITFLVSLIASYPGNLTANGTTSTTGGLVLSFLLLCLWSIGGGLVSLFGTWVVTVRHPHYNRHRE